MKNLNLWLAIFSSSLSIFAQYNSTTAQITPDDTLGSETSLVHQINETLQHLEGGASRGENLFHSFLEFNISEGDAAYFANPQGIVNIFSRVTGNNISQILGTLGVLGEANLFFVNPNGIMFGPNSQLDIAGSFVANTGSGFILPNGNEFSAINPQAPPLLQVTATAPVGLKLEGQAGIITNQGLLKVGENLTLAGGNLDLQGQLLAGGDLTLQALDTVLIRDSAINPFIAAAAKDLLIQGNQQIDIYALNNPHSGLYAFGDLVLRSLGSNTVSQAPKYFMGDAHYWTGGDFRIEDLEGNLGNLGSIKDPIIRSGGDVSFDSYLGNSLHIIAGGQVNLGLVVITGAEIGLPGIDFISEDITLSDGKIVSINGTTQPTLDVRAGVALDQIGILGFTNNNFLTNIFNFASLSASPNLSTTATSSDINIGGIAMLGQNAADGVVLLTNQYKLNQSLAGGDIEVGAILTTDEISTENLNLPVELSNVLNSFGLLEGFSGNAGDVIIDSRGNITLTKNGLPELGLSFSLINSSSSAENVGNAGDITLIAQDTISLTNNAQISASTSGIGDGGNINIKTQKLLITDGSEILAATFAQGKGGNLTINASEQVKLMGISAQGRPSGLSAQTDGTGQGGDILINTPQLILKNGAFVSTSVGLFGQGFETIDPNKTGDAGNLTINSNLVKLSGTDIGPFNPTQPSVLLTATLGSGDGGDLTINTDRLIVEDGGVILTISISEGDSGNLTVNASEFIELVGTTPDNIPSALSSGTAGSGEGKNLTINTKTLRISDGAAIIAGTVAKGRGGTLTVNTSELIEIQGIAADGRPSRLSAGSELETLTSNPIFQAFARDPLQVTGSSGNLNITTKNLIVGNGAEISTGNFGPGKGGNIQIETDSVTLENQSSISTETSSNTGGDIQLTIQDFLLLRNGSKISATAGTAESEGNGGNINISAGNIFAIPEENSDITANAFTGKGGKISITTETLFGIQPRNALTFLSDITASSQLGVDGIIEINRLNPNPTEGLTNLPSIPAEVEVTQGCEVASQGSVTFYDLGRGGLPAQPSDFLSSDSIPWIPLTTQTEDNSWNITETTYSRFFAPTSSGNLLFSCQKF